MIVIETQKKIVPATKLVPTRRDGQRPKEARIERLALLDIARHEPDVEVTTVRFLELGARYVRFDEQEEPIVVNDMPQHACCDKPDSEGHLYPVCGMSASECMETDWMYIGRK